jgi:hypothetical protein
LRRLAVAGRVAEPLRLLQRVGAAIDVLEADDERPHEAEEGIGPVRTQLRRFAKGGDGIREFVLRFGRLLVRFARFAVDPVEMAVAVPKRALQLTVVRVRGHRAHQRLARRPPLRFPDRRDRDSVIAGHALGQRRRLIRQRALQSDDADSQAAAGVERSRTDPRAGRRRRVPPSAPRP